MTRLRYKSVAADLLLALSLTLLVSAHAGASERDDPADWNYRLTPYLWGANLTASALGDTVPVPFYKLVDNLSMGFMGDFQVRRDQWTFGLDILYMDEKASKSDSFTLPGGEPLVIGGRAELTAWVVTPTVGYSLVDSDTTRFEVVGGLRYLDIAAEAKLTAQDTLLLDGKTSGANWDGIIGGRGFFELNDKWYIPVYGDVGFGDSKSTWQLLAGISYRFKKVDASLVYRYLKYTFDNDALLDDMVMKGPALGFSFYF